MQMSNASNTSARLPIYDAKDALLDAIQANRTVVLNAPTGSGKSTVVPTLLLAANCVKGQIIVLQPRRLAARLLAARVADLLGEKVGETVGYRIRFDSRVSSRTRIVFVTEAILLRQALTHPQLPDVGAVIFDEFHERNLYSDLSMARIRQIRQSTRPDLRCVIMSATLDSDALLNYWQDAQRLSVEGRAYPLQVLHCGAALGHQSAPPWERAGKAVRDAIRAGDPGSILVFMPGVYEIQRTLQCLSAIPECRAYELHALHGSLPPAQQDAAVRPSDKVKIIVATNVAETSLTIPDVRVVIDSGSARVARYDPSRGLNALLVELISKASAEQRAGRAGRTAPGKVYRLWSQAEQQMRPAHETSEIRRVDLSETLLLLRANGIQPDNFPWFEPPLEEQLAAAKTLLVDIGALKADGSVTTIGKQMTGLPMQPRLSRMLIEADQLGCLDAACGVAALLEGRPIYKVSEQSNRKQETQIETDDVYRSDLLIQLRALEYAHEKSFDRQACEPLGIHAVAARQAYMAKQQLLQQTQSAGLNANHLCDDNLFASLGRALLSAYSDHIAMRIESGTLRLRMCDGSVGLLRRESRVEASLMIACEREQREVRGEITTLVSMCHPIELADLISLPTEAFVTSNTLRYAEDLRRIQRIEEKRFKALILESRTREPDPEDREKAAELLAEQVKAGVLNLKNWDTAVEQWITRVNFVAQHCPEAEITPIDAEARQLILEQICAGATSYKELKDRPVWPTLSTWVAPEQVYYLDQWAPEMIELPNRKRPARITYTDDGKARIAVTIQDLYDTESKQLIIANGRVPLLIEILAPNRKMVQLTDDLDGFWQRTYPTARRELAGRYPKHNWR
jgi:ATP-dependent helicase HrpB